MDSATKQCPFCAETIQAAAIVCRYCGRDLGELAPALPARIPHPSDGKPSCSVCGGYVRPDSTYCKHCHVVFGVAAPAAGVPVAAVAPVPTQRPVSSPLVFAAIVIGLIIVSCLAISFLGRGGGGGGSAARVDPISAFVMCKQFVTDRLKSPATAVFPTYGDAGTQTEQLSAVKFRAHAFVDSQNSFGANIRTQYTCTVTSTGGNNWNLDDLTTDP